MTHSPYLIFLLHLSILTCASFLGASVGWSQQSASTVSGTIPPDLGVDKADLYPPYFLPTITSQAPVDHRLRHDKNTTTHLFAPSAYLLPKGSWIYQNRTLLGQHFAWSPLERLGLHGGLTFAPYTLGNVLTDVESRYSFWATLGLKARLWHSRDHTVTLLAEVHRRDGQDSRATSETGGEVGILFDALVHDRVILHMALQGHWPWSATWQVADDSSCIDRDDFFFEECQEIEDQTTSSPAGGRWLGASFGATYFVEALPMMLKAQLLSTWRTGSVRDLDRLVGSDLNPQSWIGRYSRSTPAFGLLDGAPPVSFALGVGYTWEEWISVEVSALYIGEAGGPDPLLDPWFWQTMVGVDF